MTHQAVVNMSYFQVLNWIEDRYPTECQTGKFDVWFQILHEASYVEVFEDGSTQRRVPTTLVEEGLTTQDWRSIQCDVVTHIPSELWVSIEEDLFGPDNGDLIDDDSEIDAAIQQSFWQAEADEWMSREEDGGPEYDMNAAW